MPLARDPDRRPAAPIARARTRPPRHRASARSPPRWLSRYGWSSRAEGGRSLAGAAPELLVGISPPIAEARLETHGDLKLAEAFASMAGLQGDPPDAPGR